MYSELTRRHFETAVNAGVLTGPGVRRGMAGSRAHGTWVQFDVLIGADDAHAMPAQGTHTVRDVRFQAFGCPHVIAVADWVAQHSVGRGATSALPESVAALARRFAVPTEKLGRLLVIEDAWIAALAPPSLP